MNIAKYIARTMTSWRGEKENQGKILEFYIYNPESDRPGLLIVTSLDFYQKITQRIDFGRIDNFGEIFAEDHLLQGQNGPMPPFEVTIIPVNFFTNDAVRHNVEIREEDIQKVLAQAYRYDPGLDRLVSDPQEDLRMVEKSGVIDSVIEDDKLMTTKIIIR